MKWARFSILSMVFFLACAQLPAQEDSASEYDWYRPATINPLDPRIGDFLDIDLDNLLVQANDFYQAGDYGNAARLYLVYLHYNIDDPTAIYNLACCYGLMGEPALAAGYLQRAVRDGFRNLEVIRTDSDFNKVRGEKKFARIFDSLTTLLEEVNRNEGEIKQLALEFPVQYHVKLPKWFNPGKSYPLILGLHGAGGNPGEFMRTLVASENDDYIYVTIPGPYASGGDYQPGYLWYNRENADSAVVRKSFELTAEYIADIVKHLRNEYNVSKVFLVGFSMGSRIGFGAAIKHYDLINGLIAFGGDLPGDLISDRELELAQRLRVILAHGTTDMAVPYSAAQKTGKLLREKGYEVSFYTFDGGHFVPSTLLNEILEHLPN